MGSAAHERFLAELGWTAPSEVTRAGGAVGGADACVLFDGQPVFFVAVGPAMREQVYTLRRYGWSAGLAFSVLLTPEPLLVDCRARPRPTDDVDDVTLHEDIHALLGRGAITGGSLDRLALPPRSESALQTLVELAERLEGDAPRGVVEDAIWLRFREDRGLIPYATSAAHERWPLDLYYPHCPIEFAALPTDALGELHERALARTVQSDRKASGVYYTPHHVVRYILSRTVALLLGTRGADHRARLHILDPACGGGSFLLGACRMLFAWYGREAPLTAKERARIVQRCLFGIDLDERAVRITRRALELEAGTDLDLASNIVRGNSLTPRELDFASVFPEVFATGGFDAVIGNPPYLSYGGRQSIALSQRERDDFAAHYECAGWPTSHSFFMERAAKELSRRLVSFIVPDQVGHLEGYRSLRALLAREGAITEVKYWGEDVFSGVVTPSLTFVLDKAEREAPTRIVDRDGGEHLGHVAAGAPWSISASHDLLEKLRRRSMSIRPYVADCGVRTTNAKAQVVPLADALGRFVPVLEGKQIARYACAPPEVAVRLDTSNPVFVARAEKYESARFLIRQTAAYPIVGPHDHTIYFRNSLHALHANEGNVDVRYLVGLLNSQLMRFAYAALVREASQRVFPQVKLGALGSLPIRAPDFASPTSRAEHDALVDLVEAMLMLKREARTSHDTKGLAERIRALDERIDRAVYELYELSPNDIERIESFVQTLAPAP